MIKIESILSAWGGVGGGLEKVHTLIFFNTSLRQCAESLISIYQLHYVHDEVTNLSTDPLPPHYGLHG